LVGKDAFGLASPETGQAVYGALSGDKFAAVTSVLGQPTEVEVAGAPGLAEHGLDSLQRWFSTFRVCQVRSRNVSRVGAAIAALTIASSGLKGTVHVAWKGQAWACV
jgi:hypothetical protein